MFIQDRLGRTALHYAAADFNITLLSTLIKRRVKVDMQDNEGNTAAHLAVAGPPRDPENPYSNELEDIFNRQHMDRLAYLELDPANIIQVAALLLLLKHGDRDLMNRNGETPTDIVENDELRRFIDDYLLRPDPAAAAEHDYAEIAEEVARRPPEPEYAGSGDECRVCSESTNLVTFHPCQHKVVCSGCATRMKKCLECQIPVEKKVISPDLESPEPADEKETGRLRSLEQKVQDLEEQFLCGICMERRRNVAFLCGHGACTFCTQGLVNCHMCRVKIERKIPLY